MSADEQEPPQNGFNQSVEHALKLNGEVKTNGAQQIIALENAASTAPVASLTKQHAPSIPRITDNFVPLKVVVERLVQHAYAELVNIIEVLPSQSDIAKKRMILHYIFSLRQQFIKLLVLVQWSNRNLEISRCIDVVAFLEGQKNCFSNVIWALRHVRESLLTAQVRTPDLRAALEVLSSGTFPGLRDTTYIMPTPITSKVCLDVLHTLDVTLTLRLALHETLPLCFSNYVIGNGRATIFVENEFQVSLSVGSDNNTSQWFFVDFKWAFDPASNDRSDRLWAEIEHLSNQALEKGLDALYDTLHAFTLSFKLSILHDQGRKLAAGEWKGNLEASYERRIVSLSYWNSKGNNTNTLEIGIDRPSSNLSARWIKAGASVETRIQIDPSKLSTASLLREITTLHSRIILSNLHSVLAFLCTFVDPDHLVIKLTPTTDISISINKLDGCFLLSGDCESHLLSSAAQKLDRSNAIPHDVFTTLRSYVLQGELETMAKATGWDCPRLAKINKDELVKITGEAKQIMFCRRKVWAKDWFVLVSFGEGAARWWVAELQWAKDNVSFSFIAGIPLVSSAPITYKLLRAVQSFAAARLVWFTIARTFAWQGYRVNYSKPIRTEDIFIPVVRVEGDSHYLYVRFVGLEDESVMLAIYGNMRKMKLQQTATLAKNIVFDAQRGRVAFAIRVAPDKQVVDQFMSNWLQIRLLSKYMEVIQSANLKTSLVSMNRLSFQYDVGKEMHVELNNDAAEVKFDAGDPNQRVALFLTRSLIQDGLANVIERVKACAYAMPVVDEISSERVLVLVRNAGWFRVEYLLEDKAPETSGMRHAVDVVYRTRGSHPSFFITDVGFIKQPRQIYAPIKSLRSMWTESRRGVVPLQSGLCCGLEEIGSVLRAINDRVLQI